MCPAGLHPHLGMCQAPAGSLSCSPPGHVPGSCGLLGCTPTGLCPNCAGSWSATHLGMCPAGRQGRELHSSFHLETPEPQQTPPSSPPPPQSESRRATDQGPGWQSCGPEQRRGLRSWAGGPAPAQGREGPLGSRPRAHPAGERCH